MSIKTGIKIILFCCFFSLKAISQATYQLGLMPSINLNVKLKKAWEANFRVESRQRILEGTHNENSEWKYNYILTDYSSLISKSVGLNNKIALGYLLRNRDGELIHRLIQQFTLIQRLSKLRAAHRFSTDQTFSENTSTEYRIRYRLTPEIPLSGNSLDAKELYLKINHEYLYSIEKKEYDLEIRLVPLLGYKFAEYNKLELGLDYRLNSFLNDSPNNRFWFSINWFVKIDTIKKE